MSMKRSRHVVSHSSGAAGENLDGQESWSGQGVSSKTISDILTLSETGTLIVRNKGEKQKGAIPRI